MKKKLGQLEKGAHFIKFVFTLEFINKIKKMNGYQKTRHLIGMGILNFVLYIVKLSRLLKIYCNHWN